MEHYKLVTDGLIVDAGKFADALWIEENIHNFSTFVGRRGRASGILSTDGGTVYHLAGTPVFHDFPDYPDTELFEIEPTEYEAIREELDAGKIPEEEETPAEEPQPDPEPVLTPVLMQRIIRAQAERIREQGEQLDRQNRDIEFLGDCLIEMSEVVYGE